METMKGGEKPGSQVDLEFVAWPDGKGQEGLLVCLRA